MRSITVIPNSDTHIDFSNLCGGNDFARLTNGYDRKQITKLVWSIEDDFDRCFVKEAIYIQKKLDNCPEDNEELYEELLGKQVELQKNYSEAKATRIQHSLPNIIKQDKGYTTLEWGVLFYYMGSIMKIYIKNNDCKNCDQSIAISALAKATGYSITSFTDRMNIDPADSATRKAMKKVATDFKNYLPEVSKEILRDYEEYEEDFSEREREKKRKRMAG